MAPVAAETFYTILDVPFDASEKAIKAAYKALAIHSHPDKQHGQPADRAASKAIVFAKAEEAHRCLSNVRDRLEYDLRTFGSSTLVPSGTEPQAHLDEILKKRQQIDLANMQNSLVRILERERAKGGIIIKKALYGHLRLQDEKLMAEDTGKTTIEEADLRGPFIDVTQPVQSLVEKHRIQVKHSGQQSSKAELPGFYNPAPLDSLLELELYVLYDFKGQLHEVMIGDREMISCPLRAHAVSKLPARVPRGPYSSGNVVAMMRMQEQARRAEVDGAPAVQTGGHAAPLSSTSAMAVAVKANDPSKALERAVVGYRLATLKVPYPGDASPCELATMALCSGATLTLLLGWARWCGHIR